MMQQTTIKTKITLPTDTLSAWENSNRIMLKGEQMQIEYPDGHYEIRIGDGVSTASTLLRNDLGLVTTSNSTTERITLTDKDELISYDDFKSNLSNILQNCYNHPLSQIPAHMFFETLAYTFEVCQHFSPKNI